VYQVVLVGNNHNTHHGRRVRKGHLAGLGVGFVFDAAQRDVRGDGRHASRCLSCVCRVHGGSAGEPGEAMKIIKRKRKKRVDCILLEKHFSFGNNRTAGGFQKKS